MAEEAKKLKCIVAIKIRGTISAPREVRETLQMLRLKRNNYAVIIDNSPAFLGMLKTAQNFITWGEITRDTAKMLIEKRGRLLGNKKLTDEYAKKVGYKSLDELVEAIYNCEAKYWKLPNIQPFFRLHPPTKGFKGNIKKTYRMGGEAGYRGEKINELLKRMF